MRREECATAFLGHLEARGFRSPARRGAELGLGLFFDHLRRQRVRDLRRVMEAHVVSFARRLATRNSHRTGEPLALSTQAAYLSVVHGFFRFL